MHVTVALELSVIFRVYVMYYYRIHRGP